jgi:hypothetical protein
VGRFLLSPRYAAFVVAAAFACASARRAEAYTYQSSISEGCHERLTSSVLASVRSAVDTARPLPLSEEQAPIADDLPFDAPGEMRDLGGITLLFAVRDVDLKGNAPTDAAELAQVHGDPDLQEEHCLRRPEDDEPDGSRHAIERCVAHMRRELHAALDALDESGRPDPTLRSPIQVHLAIRGKVTLSLPRFYLHMGHALHTLQDSFTHTLRSEDGLRVRVALNWVEDVSHRHDEKRDGPAHSNALDDCEARDPLRRLRRELATDASTELLLAALDPSLDREQKELALDAVLTRYVSVEDAGCSFDDDWCDAPELRIEQDCFCATPGAAPSGSGAGSVAAGSLGAAGIAALLVRRRRARSRQARTSRTAAALACALAASSLRLSPVSAEESAAQAIDPRAAAQPLGERSYASRFGYSSTFGISVENPALAMAMGFRYRVAPMLSLGVDAEWNPWASFHADVLRRGAANVSGVGILHWDVGSEVIALRTRLHLGASILLTDLYGAPSGSVGPHLQASALGVEWRIGRDVALIIDPADVAVPIPQPYGVPFVFHQHRASVTIQVGGLGD